MTIDEISEFIESLGGVLTLQPREGDGTPEIAWGDRFFYWAPDGVVPPGQPFATIVTKDYPDDATSDLDRAGAFRVNVAAGKAEFESRAAEVDDPSEFDVLFPHPVYGRLHWLSVVNPGPRSDDALRELLTTAHGLAQGRRERRG